MNADKTHEKPYPPLFPIPDDKSGARKGGSKKGENK
jgi:hypothetical protein